MMIRSILTLVALVFSPWIGEACVERVAELPGGLGSADYITIGGDIAIVSSKRSPAAWIVDISDPVHPVEMGALPVAPSVGAVAIEGDYAYVGVYHDDERPDGLSVVSLSDPLAPMEVGFVPIEVSPSDVAVRWPYAYVVGKVLSSSGMVVIDVRAPWMPIRVGFASVCYSPGSVSVEGEFAYIGRAGCPWAVPECAPSFQVVDISNVSDPKPLGELWRLGDSGSAVRDELVLGWSELGLEVIDCRNPLAPHLVHLDPVEPSPRSENSIVLGTKMAYATTYQGSGDSSLTGLYVYDIRNPAWPRRVHRHEIPGRGTGVAVSGDHVFVAAGEEGVVVYDVSACGLPTPRRPGGRATP